MFNDIVNRLKSFGYIVETADDWLINFLIKEVAQTIKNECNITEIPEGLYYVAVDMVCGEFLSAKKGSGQLDGLDMEATVKSIKEGDTQITYAIADTSITLDSLIDVLRNCGRSQFVTYRKFLW